jgi:hypothetical protein
MITVRKKMMKAYYSEQKMMTASNGHKKNDDKECTSRFSFSARTSITSRSPTIEPTLLPENQQDT